MNTIKSIIQIIAYNPIRKIFALVFAFGLWLFVAFDNEYQYERNIQIEYTQLSDSLIISDSIAELTVIFQGRGGSLFSTWAAPPKALCSMRNSDLGENVIPIRDLIITTGFGDIVTKFLAPSIRVTVDRKTTTMANVVVPIKGSPKLNYAVSGITVNDTVKVTGPAELLEDFSGVTTETLSVQNLNRSLSRKLRLTQPSPLFTLDRREVNIEVLVDTAISAVFTNIPLKLIYTPAQRVSSERISLDTLVVQGPKQLIDQLTKRDITVKITLSQIAPGEYEFPATIILPDFIRPIYSHPRRFKITIH